MTMAGEVGHVHGGRERGEEAPTALVIEDDAAISALLCDLLAEEGASVLQARDVSGGMDLARTRKPDLILLDQHLPDGTGACSLAALRREEATRGIPVIMLSGSPQALATLAPAPDALVAKPFDVDTLLCEVGRFVPRVAGLG